MKAGEVLQKFYVGIRFPHISDLAARRSCLVIQIAKKDRETVSTFSAPSISIPGGEQMKQTLNGKIIISFHFITDGYESG